MRIPIIAAVLCALASTASAQPAASRAVTTDLGQVSGATADRIEIFKGIPYAAPPVGKLRWRAPQPAAKWKGVRASDKFGPACMQPIAAPGAPGPKREEMSEDCLYLNVYRPAGAPAQAGKPLPVMVWIHGGGLTGGAAHNPLYDGTHFAQGGVVLVSINYRLGYFGFFAHPALSKANADDGLLGNYGLLDQIAALQWVKRNIAAFGGDPNNVTIFGESAGGLSVDGLMVSPLARGLFHKAISQSGYGRGQFVRLTEPSSNSPRSGEQEGLDAARAAGAAGTDLAAIRAIPAEKVLEAGKDLRTVYFILDGKTFTEDMWTTFRAGREAPVPLLIGSNSQEGPEADYDRPQFRALVSKAAETDLIKAYGGEGLYRLEVGSDVTFTQQARALARLHQKNGFPTYLYVFSAVSMADALKGQGARHATELRPLFVTIQPGTPLASDPAPREVGLTMNAMWRTFAATGSPSVPQAPWPNYDGHGIMAFTREGPHYFRVDPREARLDALSAVLDPNS